jgi:PPOX class probable F420-dependent enzyme
VIDLDDSALQFIRGHQVARLATADAAGRPQVVPICYVFESGAFFSAIDEKPKRVSPRELRRVKNIAENMKVSLVIDDYSDDWSRLAWLIVDGKAEIVEPGAAEHRMAVRALREKYPQYRSMAIESRPMIKIVPERIKRWQSQTRAI